MATLCFSYRSAILLAYLWAPGLLQQFPGNRDCALTLPGSNRPGFNGIEGSDGQPGCITYEAVNEAFLRAREKVGLRHPHRSATVFNLAQLGTALQETSRLLADRFRLSREDVALGLPRINTLRTDIADFCPRSHRTDRRCKVSRYRRHDGECNNLQHPTWGAALLSFKRLLAPVYADGVSELRVNRAGFPLPNPRVVSAHVHRNEGPHDHAVSLMFAAWGQLMDHDLTFTAETKDPSDLREPSCCGTGRRHPNCLPVALPPEDHFYRLYKQTCMNMLRSLAGVRDDCRLGPRVQTNTATAYIDGNFVYGPNVRLADELRLLKGGRLKTLPAFSDLGLKELMPLKLQFPDDGCIRSSPDIYCFLAGDNRANENMALAVLHTMLVREHNRIAAELSDINPLWDDEKIYQETRHIVAALVQHITYTEFLPMLLGKESVEKYDLVPTQDGYWNGYDPNVDVTIPSAFVTAAFRFGHSLLPSVLERWSPSHVRIGAQRLSEVLKRPFDLYKPGWYDQYVVGLVNQVAQAMDDGVTQEVTNHLFQQPSHRYGMDLASLNLQRAREHGVPGYNNYRHLCGLQPLPRWSHMLRALPNETVERYQDIYDHPDDVDLWSAGISERPMPGSMIGPTFNCLIARTFRDLRRGDRFWYENSGWPSSFTPEQLRTIKQVRLSRLLCDASDNLETLQVYAMVLPDFQTNPRISCKSRVLPRLDLSKWRDEAGQPELPQVSLGADGEEDSNSVEPPVIAEGRSTRVRFPDDSFLFDFFKK
ncbi:peroxidase-like isoform X2 [Periplaneta americana]|uniref:peroxidase-like isoform X2 n=1 Tax=Periplaneta americana TaxID=6978 RepID=UPI0037E934EE